MIRNRVTPMHHLMIMEIPFALRGGGNRWLLSAR